ncbi:TonB-dependent receptor [Luteithermobacter gelatinilyticus]|uniref:TonB-dependent receptor n=1 Tax=Luteithermobacter gelatinilyticus TaxID=2582913 RepID=UPI0011075486|nr:TonB-dependent receptor [Luteithermobacter gelatinilyticus]
MSRLRHMLSATSLIAISAAQGPVWALEADENTEITIEEITVTARKRAESIQDAPISVTAFNAQAIEDAGIRETADFIQLTSNITLAESQSISTSFLTIRGLTQVRNGEIPVAVVIDGVLQFNNRQFVQQLFDVAQIEVVKGPQGALYGRNAAGGAIIINTKEPSNETEGYLKFGYGKGDEVTTEGSVSTPIIEDELYVRLSGRMVNRDGYFTNITRDAPDDPFFDRALRGRVAWRPNDTLSVDFNANYSKHDGRGIGFQFGAASADDTSLPFRANNEDLGERETFGASLKIEKDFEIGTLLSVTSYDKINTLTRADQFPYTELANGVDDNVPFGDGTQSQYTDIEGWSQELRLTSPSDQRLRWQVGAYFLSWDRFISSTVGLDTGDGIRRVTRTPFFNVADNPTVSFFADDNDNTAWALFFQLNYDILDNLELSVAGRYDEEKRDQSVSPQNTGGVPGAQNSETFNHFSPKVTLSYAATEDINLYGTYGEGFRSGQFNQNGTRDAAEAAGIAGVDDVVDQEVSKSWEVGAKATLLDNRLRLNLAYFDTSLSGQQYFVFIGGIGAQVLINIDDVDIRGVEAEAVFRAAEGLDLYASYGYTDSEIKAYTTDPQFVGNKAPYTPDMTFNTGFQWNVGISSTLNLITRVDYERRGKQFWSPDNIFPRSALDLVNARVALEDAAGRWTLAGSVNNLTDERYNSEFVIPAFSHKANPRVWRVDFRYNF